MASLLFAGGVLAYEKIKDAKAKKTARKAHNAARYSDLQSSTCTCTHPHDTPEQEKNTKGCPVHDPEARRKGLKEEEEREREDLTKEKGKGKGEKATYNSDDGDEDGDLYSGEPRRRDDVIATGANAAGREEAPPRYEDVAAVAPVGFQDRIR
ncbi:MAG: hypothetical protein L6R42_009988 [Xanthoria sp. 1 TBL-2021]|nr:MAG: hypothetical protein L6R42_009988 [Xanthoria sp. 1 TBL-2021]